MAAVPVASSSCPVGNTGFRFSWPQCVVGRAQTVFLNGKIKRYTEIAGFVPRFRCSSVSSGSSRFCLIHVRDAPRLKSGDLVALGMDVLENYKMPETQKMPAIAVNDQ